MSIEITWEYRRDPGANTSTGRVLSTDSGLIVEEAVFTAADFGDMIAKLHVVFMKWREEFIEVVLSRTDRPGLLPCRLDPATVHLIRTDPEGAVQALSVPDRSPLGQVRRVRDATVPIALPALKVGVAVLADAFGDQLYFRVRGQELECPGCGFWGGFDVAGQATEFICHKRCGCCRFVVTCGEQWGSVDTTFLLECTRLAAFYFPRAWNQGRPWATRETVRKLYNQYLQDKGQVP